MLTGKRVAAKTAVMRAALPGSAPPHASPRHQRGVPRSGGGARRRRRGPVAAAEEERFSRRKHGKEPVPFSTWELPIQAAHWCLRDAGLTPRDLDAVAYSYDPALAPDVGADITADEWEGLRTLFARRAPRFLATALPGLDADRVRFVAHHVAHAASCGPASPHATCAVLVLDGRGERTSHLAGRYLEDGSLEILARQELPHSLGLLYEELTDHLGFRRSSDEYKVMAMASYGEPAFLDDLRRLVHARGDGGFATEPVDWERLAPRLAAGGDDWTSRHADLACSVQRRLEEVVLELATWLHERTGESALTMAGGVALNCVANMRLHESGPFDDVWVQPASGDSGTALGAALHVAHELGDRVSPMRTAALGRGWSDDELAGWLDGAGIVHERPDDLADAVAEVLAADGVVAWFQGRSEFGPRALGHRSLLADPRRAETTARLNDVKGRESFRPVAPMVLADRAAEIFSGRLPSPHMLFTHRGGTTPGATASPPSSTSTAPLASRRSTARTSRSWPRCSSASRSAPGVPVVVNTSLNTAGRPMVDDPRDALECFGSAPVDLLAIGPVRRPPPRLGGRAGPRDGGGRRAVTGPAIEIVVPTVGRPSLGRLLAALRDEGVSTRDRRRRPGGRDAARRPGADGHPRTGSRTGRRPQRRLARVARALDRLPRRRRRAPPGWCRAALRGPRRPRRRRRRPRRAGCASRCRPAGGPPTGSATSPACRTRPGRPRTWPSGARRSSRSAASTSASRAPTARTPTSGCGSWRRGGGSCGARAW